MLVYQRVYVYITRIDNPKTLVEIFFCHLGWPGKGCHCFVTLPGSASNLFALLAGGDVALSVLMTITTTIGAATWSDDFQEWNLSEHMRGDTKEDVL